MGAKDFYKILGVSEGASQDELKRAYRKLAKEHHPDTHPGDKQAEQRFKEVSEAYNVLSDPKKRQQYDQMRKYGFGGGGPGGRGFQGFDFGNFDFGGFQNFRGARSQPGGGFSFEGFNLGGLGDIFAQFFDLGERTRQRRYGPRRGEDLLVQVSVSFETAAAGGKASFTVEKDKTCPVCSGGGAKPGSTVKPCPECGGRGTVVIGQGGFGVSRPCPRCYGRGQIIENPCDRCHGSGIAKGKRSYSIKIPAGMEEGGQVRLKGEGQPGVAGGPKGDMIVTVRVQPHRFFSKRGKDITCDVPLSLAQAVNGAKIRVKTIDGKKVQVAIPAGTQDGTSFRLAGMGISKNGRKGDQYVRVKVALPSHPTKEEKELLKQYQSMAKK